MKNKGFTLIELLVVIAIIGILSTIAMVGLNYAREYAKISNAQHDVAELYTAISALANDTGQWPGHQTAHAIPTGAEATNNEICGSDANSQSCAHGISEGWSGVVLNDSSTPYNNWTGPYMNKIPLDPWGHEYFFDTDYLIDVNDEPNGCGGGGSINAVVIGSYGPDGQGLPNTGATGAYGCDDIIKIIFK